MFWEYYGNIIHHCHHHYQQNKNRTALGQQPGGGIVCVCVYVCATTIDNVLRKSLEMFRPPLRMFWEYYENSIHHCHHSYLQNRNRTALGQQPGCVCVCLCVCSTTIDDVLRTAWRCFARSLRMFWEYHGNIIHHCHHPYQQNKNRTALELQQNSSIVVAEIRIAKQQNSIGRAAEQQQKYKQHGCRRRQRCSPPLPQPLPPPLPAKQKAAQH